MKTVKSKDIITFLSIVGAIVLINFIASTRFFRWDLTEEKRFSINDATINLLEDLDDYVYIEVYLEGEFPAGFKRLQSTIRETLEEFKIYAGDNIIYSFVDPNNFEDSKKRNEFHLQLAKKGIQPTNLVDKEDGQRVEKIMFPGAIVRYGEKEITVQLLSGKRGSGAEEQLNHSVEAVEYNFANAIRKLSTEQKKKIGFLQGHGEIKGIEATGFTNLLEEYYHVEVVDIHSKVDLYEYDMIICAKPQKKFSDTSLFKLDQYLVKGGKALFLIDPMNVVLDSIGEAGTFALPYNLNLTNLLFKTGVRVNNDLIKDYYSGLIPMMTGYVGNQPRMQMMPWRFYPMISKFGDHPISKNLGGVYTKFVSTIDTVKAPGVTKTPLMYTSDYSKIIASPVRLNFNDARLDLEPSAFNSKSQAIGYLLEGKFKSMFKGYLSKKSEEAFNFKEEDQAGKVIVFSDGDLAKNDYHPTRGTPYALGYDMYLRRNFANADLLINCVDYLMDESGLIEARAKDIELRPLDKVRIKKSKLMIQVLNICTPVLLIILFGILWFVLRKRKYQNFV